MNLVLDASVVLKWLFNDPENEELTQEATGLIEAALEQHRVIQPVHWLAEVSAVLARKTPTTVERNVILLDALGWNVVDDVALISRACRLSSELDHHLFDTLYHAVALDHNAVLFTADRRYFNKAHHVGRIAGLETWRDLLAEF